jgi:uncharacterized membrane-anchored protein
MNQDGLLLILWGWILFIKYFLLTYLPSLFHLSNETIWLLRPASNFLVVLGAFYTFYYLYKTAGAKTYIRETLKYIWGGLIIVMVMVSLIINNALGESLFVLQHPLFMLITGFAILVTGGLLRTNILVFGGGIFGLLALLASRYELYDQLLIESIGWLIAFIIPGHVLYASRDKANVQRP